MIYLKAKDVNTGIHFEILTDLWDDIHSALFSPDIEPICLIDFRTHGKTYKERKADLEQKAIDFSNNSVGDSGDLFWSDINAISTWFENMGKRYGLLKEFRENWIC